MDPVSGTRTEGRLGRLARKLPHELEVALVVLCCFGSFGCLAIAGGSSSTANVWSTRVLWHVILAELAISSVVAPFLWLRGWKWSSLDWGFTVRTSFVALPLWLALEAATYALVMATGSTHGPRLAPEGLTWSAITMVCIINPPFEELIALGYLFRSLERQGPVAVIAFSTCMRLVSHLGHGQEAILAAVPIGVVFGIAYWHFRRLWPFVLAHSLADAIGLVMLHGRSA